MGGRKGVRRGILYLRPLVCASSSFASSSSSSPFILVLVFIPCLCSTRVQNNVIHAPKVPVSFLSIHSAQHLIWNQLGRISAINQLESRRYLRRILAGQ